MSITSINRNPALQWSVARNRYGPWTNAEVSWDTLISIFTNPGGLTLPHMNYTLEEYEALSKPDRDRAKSTKCYIMGTLKGETRRINDVVNRTGVVLDIDHCDQERKEIQALLRDKLHGYEFIEHPSVSHSPRNTSLRIIIPLAKPCKPEQYAPLARKLMGMIDIELFDTSAAQANRLFYFPLAPAGVSWVATHERGQWVDPDVILGDDWEDVTTWPKKLDEKVLVQGHGLEREDPTAQGGLPGAVCRAYDIKDAVELTGAWEQAGERYRWLEGSGGAGGAILGDFFYSHHDTDPNKHQAMDAYQVLVAYGFEGIDRQPEVIEQIRVDEEARRTEAIPFDPLPDPLLIQDYLKYQGQAVVPLGDTKSRYGKYLCFDTKDTQIQPVMQNAVRWLHSPDVDAVGAFRVNALTGGVSLIRPILDLEIDDMILGREMGDNEILLLREKLTIAHKAQYGSQAVRDAVTMLASTSEPYSPVEAYLRSRIWDGKPRIDTAFTTYLGADDNEYTRAVSSLFFRAAAKRAIDPGCKFDSVPVLDGAEGIGKSRFCAALVPRDSWFNDDLPPLDGNTREVVEAIQDVWITELSELTSIKKSAVQSVKSFLSRRADKARLAYARQAGRYARRGVFIGSTNETEYLTSLTGNRRFLPVHVRDCDVAAVKRDRNQLWAEALFHVEHLDDRLYLVGDAAAQAKVAQTEYLAENPFEGLVCEYLDGNQTSTDWIRDSDAGEDLGIPREFACAREIYEKAIKAPQPFIPSYHGSLIKAVVAEHKNWEFGTGKLKRYGTYGPQRNWFKKRV